MKKVDTTITMSIIVECPYCESVMDLMDLQYLKDDGYIYKMLLSAEEFGKENWNEQIQCDECGKEFIIENVIW